MTTSNGHDEGQPLGVVGVLTRWDTLAAVCLSLTPLTYIAVLLLLVLLPRPDSPPGGH